MARLHSRRKGKSQSHKPPVSRQATWVGMQPEEVEALIVKLKREGMPNSQIGETLRDEYGIPGVKYILNKSLKQVLEDNKLVDPLPEDLLNLLTKAQRLIRHLQVHKTDRKNKHALELIEAKIHRLAKYYKRKGLLSLDWKYKTVVAQLE